jgi:hypothetical protein
MRYVFWLWAWGSLCGSINAIFAAGQFLGLCRGFAERDTLSRWDCWREGRWIHLQLGHLLILLTPGVGRCRRPVDSLWRRARDRYCKEHSAEAEYLAKRAA